MLDKINLQLFAEEIEEETGGENDSYEEVEDVDTDGENLESETGDEEKEEPRKVEFSEEQQEELNRIINKVFTKKRASWEQETTKRLGVRNLNEAVQYTQAGKAVAISAKTTPAEIVNRLQAKGLYNPNGAELSPADKQGLEKDIEDMKAILYSEREEKVKEKEEQEAVKSFGNKIYREHEDEIVDKAEELGLSLVDAAAIVLRPKLTKLAEDRIKSKQAERTRKSIDSGDGAANSKGDFSGQLNQSQKRVAQKMGMSYKEYYEELKDLGRL